MPGMTKAVSGQWTLAICKPDAVRRGLVGAILHAFEAKELSLRAITMLVPSEAQIRENYRANEDEPWFAEMVGYMTSGPIVPMAWYGPNAIDSARQVIGAKDPWESEAGSLRAKYAADPIRTVVHGSRDPVEALRELNLWFPTLLGREDVPTDTKAAGITFTRPLAPLALKTFVAVRDQRNARLGR